MDVVAGQHLAGNQRCPGRGVVGVEHQHPLIETDRRVAITRQPVVVGKIESHRPTRGIELHGPLILVFGAAAQLGVEKDLGVREVGAITEGCVGHGLVPERVLVVPDEVARRAP